MSVLEIPAFGYLADLIDDDRPSLSRSVIHEMCSKSPAHGRAAHPRLNPLHEVKTKREFDIGTSAHQVLLEGEAQVDVLAYDDWKRPISREQAAESRLHGKIPLLEKEWDLVSAMIEAVRPQLAEFDPVPFTEGTAEQTLVWEQDGVLLRARPDWLRDDLTMIDDFKTASQADPERWSKNAVDYGYDLQAVVYTRGVRAVLGRQPEFRFIVVEKAPPFLVTEWKVAPDAWQLAERKVDWAINMWRRCLETGVWPGYSSETCWVNLEPWHEPRWLDKEAKWAA